MLCDFKKVNLSGIAARFRQTMTSLHRDHLQHEEGFEIMQSCSSKSQNKNLELEVE